MGWLLKQMLQANKNISYLQLFASKRRGKDLYDDHIYRKEVLKEDENIKNLF